MGSKKEKGVKMNIYNFINQKYTEQQRTGKSSIKFPELKVKTQLQLSKKLNSDKMYRCGHPVKAVIINTTPESLSTYMEWKESNSDLCLSCYIKHRNEQR